MSVAYIDVDDQQDYFINGIAYGNETVQGNHPSDQHKANNIVDRRLS